MVGRCAECAGAGVFELRYPEAAVPNHHGESAGGKKWWWVPKILWWSMVKWRTCDQFQPLWKMVYKCWMLVPRCPVNLVNPDDKTYCTVSAPNVCLFFIILFPPSVQDPVRGERCEHTLGDLSDGFDVLVLSRSCRISEASDKAHEGKSNNNIKR